MKRTLLFIFVAILTQIHLFAQEDYKYFPTGMKWKEVLAEPNYLPLDTLWSYLYEIGGDTLVNDKLCKTIIKNGQAMQQWVFEENEKVWIITDDYPEPILIYNFDWNDENAYCEFLRIHDSLETEQADTVLVKSYLKRDEIQAVNYKDSTIDCLFDYNGTTIRHIGRVAELLKGPAMLGYIIEEPIIPGMIFSKVLWIVRNGEEIFRSEIAEEWTCYIPNSIFDIPSTTHYPQSSGSRYYDLQGRQQRHAPTKGVYIQDGKKLMVK